MDALFASGRIVDLILALVLGEALLLAWLRRRGIGPSWPALAANLASGAALMLALRAALTGSGWTAVAGWLLAGLAAHLADLGLRFRAGAHGRIAADRARQELAQEPVNAAPRSRAAVS